MRPDWDTSDAQCWRTEWLAHLANVHRASIGEADTVQLSERRAKHRHPKFAIVAEVAPVGLMKCPLCKNCSGVSASMEAMA